VIANMGLAFLSLHTAPQELAVKSLVVLDVVGLPLVRSWHVVSLRSRPMSGAADCLRAFISEFGKDFITRQFDGMHALRAVAEKASGVDFNAHQTGLMPCACVNQSQAMR
jgi:hypothetical protein